MGKISIDVQKKPNNPPTVSAGGNISINLPATGVVLTGSATDSDGYIVSQQWSKLSGGSVTIVNPDQLITSVTGLQQGVYQFQLIAYDNEGLSGVATIQVTVGSYQLYPAKWIAGSVDCEKNGQNKNTGKLKFINLLKVSDDVNQYPLDINNQRITDTNLSQATKPNVSGDADYIPPFASSNCPTEKRFHSLVGNKTAEKQFTSVNNSNYLANWGLDNNTVIEDSMPGKSFTILMGDQLQVLKVVEAGDYAIKVRGNGVVTVFTDNGAGWTCFVDFLLRVNGTVHQLSPSNPPLAGFDKNYQYFLGSPGGSASHKEASVNYNLAIDLVVYLPVNALVEWIIAPRFETTPNSRTGTFRINNSSLELDIIS